MQFDPPLSVLFDGNTGMQFTQGEDRTFILTISQSSTSGPVNLTGGTVEINLPLAGGGSIKRTSGNVSVPSSAVNVSPSSIINLIDHGFVTGDTIQVSAQPGGSLPSGLSASTNYLISVIDVNDFQITDTSGNVIPLTSQGTVGFYITNSNDVQITTPTAGQVTFNLRAAVSEVVNAALAQSFQVAYILSGKTRIAVISNLLDVIEQPVP